MAKRSKRKGSGPPTGTGAKVIATPDYRLDQSISRHDWIRAIGLILATFLAYQMVWHAGFIWDDDQNITDNVPLRTWHGLWQIWSAPGSTQQYYPLTHSSFWLEYHLWQLDPLGYHLDNVLLHLGNSFLILIILRKLKVPGAWLAAALFALHPVNVESVAWATERKNTLSALFYLTSILAALEFWKLGEPSNKRPISAQWRFYWLALFLYFAALVSKTATVPLPLVLLLLLWWKRGRLQLRDLCQIIPFLGIGVVMGLVTITVETNHVGTHGNDWAFSWPERLILVGKQLWFYFAKLIWPHPLIFVYPRWEIDASQPLMYVPLLAALTAMFFLWAKRNSHWRPIFVTATYFVLLILPATSLFNQYYFRFSFVSDHFQYLACMGPLALAAAAITSLINSAGRRRVWIEPVVGTSLPVLLGALTWFQTQRYCDMETLWRVTLARNPSSWLAHDNLGYELQRTGRRSEAMTEFQIALQLKPDDPDVHFNMGRAFQQVGREAEATEQYRSALALNPLFPKALDNLGVSLQRTGHTAEAIDQLRQALAIRPDFADAHNNLGFIFQQTGRLAEAVDQYQLAVKFNPDYAEAHYNLGNLLLQTGRLTEAIGEYQTALTLNPGYAEAHNNLGLALQRSGQTDAAAWQYQAAISLKPDYVDAHNNFGTLLGQQGHFAEAADQFRQALRVNPNDVNAQDNLNRAEGLPKARSSSK